MPSYYLNAALKGLIEGVTEFIPVSSTGHLILVRDLLPLTADSTRAKALDNVFDIVVQFPAILAIVVLYRRRLIDALGAARERPAARRFWLGLVLAFIPLAVVGMLFKDTIEAALFAPRPVAIALIVGGIVLLGVERWLQRATIPRAEDVPLPAALGIGLFQCLALIPGTSRSAATIIGGRLLGCTRGAAAEFSFFLAIPVLGAAFVYKLAREHNAIVWASDGPLLLIGCVASFVSALLVVSLFMRFLERYTLAVFGWYRIALGIVVLLVTR